MEKFIKHFFLRGCAILFIGIVYLYQLLNNFVCYLYTNKKGQNKNSYIAILTLSFYLKDSS